MGHDNLTLSGTGFPRYLTDNVIDIEFSNPEKSKCIAQMADSTTLVCLTDSFDKVQGLSQELSTTITINGVQLVNDLKLKMKDVNKRGTVLTPSSVSPVLKQKIKFTLEPDFPFELKKEDFTVNITLIELSP